MASEAVPLASTASPTFASEVISTGEAKQLDDACECASLLSGSALPDLSPAAQMLTFFIHG